MLLDRAPERYFGSNRSQIVNWVENVENEVDGRLIVKLRGKELRDFAPTVKEAQRTVEYLSVELCCFFDTLPIIPGRLAKQKEYDLQGGDRRRRIAACGSVWRLCPMSATGNRGRHRFGTNSAEKQFSQ
jgi:hypothetical protein